jgi:hypothetical protein
MSHGGLAGMVNRLVRNGDKRPYRRNIHRTARLLADKMRSCSFCEMEHAFHIDCHNLIVV